MCGDVVRCFHGLSRAEAVGVVLKGVLDLPRVHGHFHELTAVPRHIVTVIGQGIANSIMNTFLLKH